MIFSVVSVASVVSADNDIIGGRVSPFCENSPEEKTSGNEAQGKELQLAGCIG